MLYAAAGSADAIVLSMPNRHRGRILCVPSWLLLAAIAAPMLTSAVVVGVSCIEATIGHVREHTTAKGAVRLTLMGMVRG